MTPLSTRLAWRYLWSGRGDRFVSLVSIASIGGLAVGVAALIVVTSVMNGFRAELERRILGMVPHIVVYGSAAVPGIPGVLATAPFAEARGLLVYAGRSQSVQIFGIAPAREAEMSILPRHMVRGRLAELRGDGLLMGAPLAASLGVGIGEGVTLVLPGRAGGRFEPRFLTRTLVGLFEVDAEVDYQLVVVDSAGLAGAGPAVRSGIRLTLNDPLRAEQVRAALQRALPDATVETWSGHYGELFDAVAMERTLMFLLLAVIVAVAAFNIVTNTVMVIDEKRREIAILRTMGLAAGRVRALFLQQGLMIAGFGIALGLVAGLVLARHIDAVMGVLEMLIGDRLLAGTYFVNVPVLIRPGDVAGIVLFALLASTAAGWYAARRTRRLSVVEALHDL